MKNTLSITKNYICSCVDSVADGTNSIFVAVDVGNVVNPQFKVWLNDTLKSTVELITNEINYVNLPPDLFTANGVIKFQCLDSTYTGQIFTINFPSTLEGNLSVTKTSDYVFTAKYTKSGSGGGLSKEEIVNLIYPIGSIFIGVNNINPSTFLGGKWEAWGSGKVPVGVNTNETEFNTVEKTGGEKTHLLTTSEIPSHTHGLNGHTHSFGHTHTTPATNVEYGGYHTHNTYAATVQDIIRIGANQSSAKAIVWEANRAPSSYGRGKQIGTTNRSETFYVDIPSLGMTNDGFHTHTLPAMSTNSQNTATTGGNSGNTTATGGGTGHNNLQPYITCYMWKRTE